MKSKLAARSKVTAMSDGDKLKSTCSIASCLEEEKRKYLTSKACPAVTLTLGSGHQSKTREKYAADILSYLVLLTMGVQ